MADQPLVNLVATFGVAGLDALKAEIASANATVTNLGTLAQAAGRQLSGMAGTGAVLAGVAQSGADLGGELAGAASAGQSLAAVNLSAVKGNVVTLTDATQGLNQALGQSGQGVENIEAVGEAAEKAAGKVQELGQAQTGAQGKSPAQQQPGRQSPELGQQLGTAGQKTTQLGKAWSEMFGPNSQQGKGIAAWTAGLATLNQGIGTVSVRLPGFKEAVGQSFKTLTDPRTWQTIGTGLSSLGGALQWPVMGLYGLAAAGFYASSSGQVFGYQMQELSRQVGSVFAPVIKGIIDKMSSLIHWFQTLTGAQQANLRFWGLLAGGIVSVSMVAPRLVASFKMATVAVQTFSGVFRGMGLAIAANPWLLVVGALGALILVTQDWTKLLQDLGSVLAGFANAGRTVFESLAGSIKKATDEAKTLLEKLETVISKWAGVKGKPGDGKPGEGRMGPSLWEAASPFGALTALQRDMGDPRLRKPLESISKSKIVDLVPGLRLQLEALLAFGEKKKEGQREELAPPLRGFESIDAAYKRISEAGIKATAAGGFKSPQEEAVEQLKQIYSTIIELKTAAGNIKPAVV